MKNELRIKSAVEPLYVEMFGRDGFGKLNIELQDDHAGEPSVFLRALVLNLAAYSSVKSILSFEQRVRAAVREIEPQRFCYIQYRDGGDVRAHSSPTAKRLKRLAS
jgi:hypothetical protein